MQISENTILDAAINNNKIGLRAAQIKIAELQKMVNSFLND